MQSHSQRTLSGKTQAQNLGFTGSIKITVRPLMLNLQETLSAVVRSVGQTFDAAGFAETHSTLPIGSVDLDGVPPKFRVSSLPVKMPGTDYRVPIELSAIQELIALAASFEHAINSEVGDYYAYITVQQDQVQPGAAQRGHAIHSDGIQGPRIQPKTAVERGYLAVNYFAPLFYEQSFDITNVDVDIHLMDHVFESQAREGQAVACNQLVCFDSYSVHQAQPATHQAQRTFVRMAYSQRQYDRLGNSINHLFDREYQDLGWQMQARPLPTHLVAPPRRSTSDVGK